MKTLYNFGGMGKQLSDKRVSDKNLAFESLHNEYTNAKYCEHI